MSIGLWDADFMTYKQPIFNLELMKLAAYYKQQRQIVSFAPVLEPERYTKFFVRKDWDDGEYPKQFFKSNVEYGGRAFAPNYIAIAPEIEAVQPDTHLYDRYEKDFKTAAKNAFKTMTIATHLRATYDEQTIAQDIERRIEKISNQSNTVIFHDYNLSDFPYGLELIHQIIKEYSTRSKNKIYIGAKFPIQINNNEQLIQWLSFNTSARFYTLQINNIMNDESFNLLLQQSANKCDNFEYMVTATSSSEDDFIINRLPIIYKQLLISQNRGKRILLKYEHDFFEDKRWEKLINYLNFFNGARAGNVQRKRKMEPISLYKFIKDYQRFEIVHPRGNWPRQPYSFDEIRDLFQLVRIKNYEVFKMFYENTGEEFV